MVATALDSAGGARPQEVNRTALHEPPEGFLIPGISNCLLITTRSRKYSGTATQPTHSCAYLSVYICKENKASQNTTYLQHGQMHGNFLF